jgi:penicillin-binding protein 1A
MPVLSQEEAFLMVSMMKDVVRKGTAAGAVAGAGFTVPAGGKTGTTNDGTDVWFVGFTPDLVAGVWIGTDKPSKIKSNAQGGQLAAPAWTSFMRAAYRRKPTPPDWPQPAGIVSREVDVASGMLASPGCGPSYTEFFIAGTEPVQACVPPMLPYDTSAYPVTPYPTTPYPGDTLYRPPGSQTLSPGQAQPLPTPIPPGGVPAARPPAQRPVPRDTIRPPRDTGLFSIPPRRDSTRRPPDTSVVRPPVVPPDTSRPVRPQGSRPSSP